MAKIIVACICALFMFGEMQPAVSAADSTYYEILQTHNVLGRVRICMTANSLRMDLVASHVSILASAPDWSVTAFNTTTKRQSIKTFDDWCKGGLENHVFFEMNNLEGQGKQKIPITFKNYKALKLTYSGQVESVDKNKDGISWSVKRKMVPVVVTHVFLDGIKTDSHIAKMVSAVYLFSWQDRIPLVYYRDYGGGPNRLQWLLDTGSIEKISNDKATFKKPQGFQVVPMKQVTQSSFEFFN
jgi:hypothetical protein